MMDTNTKGRQQSGAAAHYSSEIIPKAADHSGEGPYKVEFCVNYETKPGQWLSVAGNINELGENIMHFDKNYRQLERYQSWKDEMDGGKHS